MIYDFEEIERVAGQIQAPLKPQVGIITGSGLSGLAREVEEALVIPCEEIPDFPQATVEGHPGQMFLGYMDQHDSVYILLDVLFQLLLEES